MKKAYTSSNSYVELVIKDLRARNKIVPLNSIELKIRDEELYTSFYIYTKSMLEYVRNNGSVRNYNGDVSFNYIWIDIDYEADREIARLQALGIVKKLHKEYGVPKGSLLIYFSGNKGFHIGIHSKMISKQIKFNNQTPTLVKSFVQEICEGFEIDESIYHHTAIFRFPYSINSKTGLYKILLTYEELDMNIDYIMEKAFNVDKLPEFIFPKYDVNPKLEYVYFNSKPKSKIKSQAERKNGNIFGIPIPGSRNKMLFKQAFRLFKIGKENRPLKENEIVELIYNQARLSNIKYKNQSNDPISQREIQQILNSAKRRSNE